MKTKLLKKVRERYSIEYHPNGGFVWGRWNPHPYMLFIDSYDSWRSFDFTITEKSSKEQINAYMLKYLRESITQEYIKYGIRRQGKAKQSKFKLWWTK